jgi:RHS repeat-associated protein
LQRITNATDGTFHQAYSYKDALGNFNGIFRNDLVKTNGNWALQNIDDNAYFYGNPLSSKISNILDYTGSQLGYKANSGTYAYDANGNTTYDPANKVSTVYNYLNLPSKFTKDDGTKQEILYDFSGIKWQEKEYLADGNIIGLKSYLGSFEFEGNKLSRVFHGTGFVQNLAADVSSGGQTNGNITGSNIVSTQKLKSGVKSEYIADKSICLLPGFESLPTFNAEIKPLVGFQWNYILRDHLGNTRVLFADKNGDGLIRQDASEALNEVLSLSNYSPFGLELGGSHQNLKQQFDFKFNGKQDNGFSGFTDFGARWLDKFLGKWTSVDPLAENYTNISNYIFVVNNPIKFIDPDGREIWINYGDGQKVKYENGRLFNEDGSKYKGKDAFVGIIFKNLNQINSTAIGKSVLGSLSESKSDYSFVNSKSKTNDGKVVQGLSFQGLGNGGGTIQAGYLMSNLSRMSSQVGSNIESVAHEIFHGYQNEKGEKGETINREVGAYLFGKAITTNLGYGFAGFGNFSKAGQVYDKSMTELMFSDKFNQTLYNVSINTFKTGSVGNSGTSGGIYNKFKIIPSDKNPVIKRLFPLIR